MTKLLRIYLPFLTELLTKNTSNYIVRLLTFVPGTLLRDVPYTKELLFELGELAGKFDNVLKVIF